MLAFFPWEKIVPHVIAVQESFVTPQVDIAKEALNNSPKYAIDTSNKRFERKTIARGGVMMLIDTTTIKNYTFVPLKTQLEAIAVTVSCPSSVRSTLTVCSLNLPGVSQQEQQFRPTKQKLRHLVSKLPHPFVICSDANAHNSMWSGAQSHTWQPGKMVGEVFGQGGFGVFNE